MRILNETLTQIREALSSMILDEVSKDPIMRAKDRMRDAWKRGGFKKLMTGYDICQFRNLCPYEVAFH